MSDEFEVTSLDEILYDIAGTEKAESKFAEFFASNPERVQVRTRGGLPALAGRSLLSRCSERTQKRYETLLYFEEMFPPSCDHGFLIGPACQIVESELDRLLTAPARNIVDSLIDAIRAGKHGQEQATILEKWSAKQIPTTMGVQSVVLLALRRGWEHQVVAICDFLSASFQPRYADLLASKKLGSCLDMIRTKFRNPVCHGETAFDEGSYARFVHLVIANRRFVDWDSRGPLSPSPDAEVGVFHHHLAQARRLRDMTESC
jgi:hypothetical protein